MTTGRSARPGLCAFPFTRCKLSSFVILRSNYCSLGGEEDRRLQNVALLLTIHRLPDHSIRSRQHIRRNRQADLLGGFQIDHKLELLRLLDRKVAGLAPLRILST